MTNRSMNFKLKSETMENIKFEIEREIGIPYDEFQKLNIYEQQRIIKEKARKKRKNTVRVMIGSGEHAMFINVPRGTKIMLEDGMIVKVGFSLEEYRKERDKKIDRMLNKEDKAIKKIIKPTIKQKVLSLFKK